MTAISLKNNVKEQSHVLVLTQKFKNEFNLPEKVNDYIVNALKEPDRKSLTYNYIGKYISIFIIDTKKDKHHLAEQVRKHAASVADGLNAHKAEAVFIYNQSSRTELTLYAAEGLALANYEFVKHKPSLKTKHSLQQIILANTSIKTKQIEELNAVIDATLRARDLVNEPVNKLNAVALADAFKKMGKEAGFQVTVLNKKEIIKHQMGGLLAVNAGSVDEPTFTIMEYKPKRPKNKKPYVLVGKGVVYDTGGLSLKPTPNSMDSMKCDMAGAAAVGAAMYAIAKNKLNVHVIALAPATDNRPGFNAFAPGDIITMMDGSTVEMLNSDAEGRMILADALHFAKQYSPELLIDIATLTGAAMAAIGTAGMVGMGTATKKQKDLLMASGLQVHERIAEFPFWEEYDDLMKSDIADQKNIGGPLAGAITAGKFLEKFTNYPYFHLDIAGPAFLSAKDAYRTKGGTGYGVRLFYEFMKRV
ncbi:MAG: peptidase M17 [Bacteroidota bacterium]